MYYTFIIILYWVKQDHNSVFLVFMKKKFKFVHFYIYILFLTVNYNEELSGLYGGVLLRQTRFAAACVSRILSLYKTNKYTKSVPTTVILIGHSMVSKYTLLVSKY